MKGFFKTWLTLNENTNKSNSVTYEKGQWKESDRGE